jgi:hypothetical protein
MVGITQRNLENLRLDNEANRVGWRTLRRQGKNRGCAMRGAVRGAGAELAKCEGNRRSVAEGVSARNCVTKHYAVLRDLSE